MLALFGLSCAQVHTGLDETPASLDKVPSELQRDLASGIPRDVLVELAPQPEPEGAEVGVSTQPLLRDLSMLPPSIARPMSDAEVEARAAYYQKIQESVLDAVDPSEVELRIQYEHVPFLFVNVSTLHGLFALANRDEVLRLHEERFLDHEFVESLPLIHQPEVAATGKTGAGTSVAVLDTGADFTRSEFGSCKSAGAVGCKVAYAADLATNDRVNDDDGHGTNVSAIVLGVAPSSKVLALDVFAGASAPSSAILAAIDWTIKNRATYNIVAMNMSLGSGMYNAACASDLFATALANARSAGIVPAVASGNNGYTGALASPACVPAAVSVGAVYDANLGGLRYSACSDPTTAADKVTCFSNSASFLSVLAPGAAITAGGFRMTGTSQAAPHVAGALAVVRAAFPNESLSANIARVTNTGPSVTDARNKITKRRLDLLAAVSGAATADNTGPTGSVAINANAEATNSTSVTLTISGSDPSGVKTMCISNSGTCTSFENFATSKTWTLLSGDGDKTVRIALKDGADNQTIVTDSIKLDTSVPVGGTLRAQAGDRRVALSWTAATDTGSGIASYRVVSAPNSAPACTSGTLVYAGTALSFTHTGLINGTVYGYRLCPADKANNLGAGSTATARAVPELNAPVGKVTIDQGAPLTRRTAVTLSLSATDASGVIGMCISNTASCTSWEPFTTSKAWTLAKSSGPTTVYAWFKDKYENANAQPVSATVTVDITAPTGGTFNAAAGVKQIVLSWTTASDPSGIDSYRLVYAPGTNPPASCAAGIVAYKGTSLGFTHGSLVTNTSYSYRLCAIDKAGNVSGGLIKTATAR